MIVINFTFAPKRRHGETGDRASFRIVLRANHSVTEKCVASIDALGKSNVTWCSVNLGADVTHAIVVTALNRVLLSGSPVKEEIVRVIDGNTHIFLGEVQL